MFVENNWKNSLREAARVTDHGLQQTARTKCAASQHTRVLRDVALDTDDVVCLSRQPFPTIRAVIDETGSTLPSL